MPVFEQYPRYKIIFIAFLMEGLALLLAFLLAGYFNIDLFPLTQNAFRDLLIGSLGAILPFAIFLFSLSKKAEKVPLLGSLRRIVITDIKSVFSDTRLLDLIMISAIAGIAEEVLFRGIIQTKFGIVIASIVFGLVHLVSPAYVIVTMIMGFYIGAFYYISGSLLIPIQMHFIYDLAALVYLRYFIENYEK
jgi:membrane protease YdiL (CAAX protease family)